MDNQKIGTFISACRKEKGLTQAQLAEQLGVTNKAVSKWESGNGIPDISLFPVLSELLGVTADELRGERTVPPYRDNPEAPAAGSAEREETPEEAGLPAPLSCRKAPNPPQTRRRRYSRRGGRAVCVPFRPGRATGAAVLAVALAAAVWPLAQASGGFRHAAANAGLLPSLNDSGNNGANDHDHNDHNDHDDDHHHNNDRRDHGRAAASRSAGRRQRRYADRLGGAAV